MKSTIIEHNWKVLFPCSIRTELWLRRLERKQLAKILLTVYVSKLTQSYFIVKSVDLWNKDRILPIRSRIFSPKFCSFVVNKDWVFVPWSLPEHGEEIEFSVSFPKPAKKSVLIREKQWGVGGWDPTFRAEVMRLSSHLTFSSSSTPGFLFSMPASPQPGSNTGVIPEP